MVEDADFREIARYLLDNKGSVEEVLPNSPIGGSVGVYALFLELGASLEIIEVPTSRIAYVGVTDDSFDARNHFNRKNSGFSTLRRSIGAILREELKLQAIPRSPGPSKSNFQNYAFTGDGETRLSEWMRGHLTCARYATSGNLGTLESDLIRLLEPPLNLTKWKNPQAARIKELRQRCKFEAERWANAGT